MNPTVQSSFPEPAAAGDVFAGASGTGRWMGWRLRALFALALVGCLCLFLMLRALAQSPHLDVTFRQDGGGRLELIGSGHAEMETRKGHRLTRLVAADRSPLSADSALLWRSPRWAVDDLEREHILASQAELAQLVHAPLVSFDFDDGVSVQVAPRPRGFSGLGTTFWLLSALALMLYLIAAVAFLSRPGTKNLLYAVMVIAQSGNLMMIAVESCHGWGLPAGLMLADLRLRTLFDLVSAAAVLNVAFIHPRRLHGAGGWSAACWALAVGYGTLAWSAPLPHVWWYTQYLLIGYGVAMVATLTWVQRQSPHPVALVLRRLGLAATSTLTLLTLAIALTGKSGQDQQLIAGIGSIIWYVFFASLLLLVPFLSRSQHVMREFAMLAGLSTVATSLDLLFITAFALGQFTSLALALFIAIGLYAGARQWLLTHLSGTSAMTAERTFESLYRAARAIESTPQHSVDHVARLLNELFEPLELRRHPRRTQEAQVAANGTVLAVPLPRLPLIEADTSGSLVLRHARRGRRLFVLEDARLVNRVLEQLRSAVVYDRAVEQGRTEERMRLAQDLHDDIGARLLTLMYKAPTPEMEEYVRHTLQDLKTLTRGLAAAEHPLSHAAAEWKTDIAQRLAASHARLSWSFQAQGDVTLTVVQWSGLTRILRELVNNVIAHAGATEVEISGSFENGELQLNVADDGQGHDPQTWSHGLGLGGVRKRVKVLGGQVRWRARQPRGIVCEVRIARLGEGAR